MTPELHRPLPADRVGAQPLEITLDAQPSELPVLAMRLGIPALHALRCRFRVRRLEAQRIEATGDLAASVDQVCVVSLEPFTTAVAETFLIHLVPDDALSDSLDPDDVDEVGYQHGVIDLGEAAVEQLALALDPYPRKPQAELPGWTQDDVAGPFAALAGLKPRA